MRDAVGSASAAMLGSFALGETLIENRSAGDELASQVLAFAMRNGRYLCNAETGLPIRIGATRSSRAATQKVETGKLTWRVVRKCDCLVMRGRAYAMQFTPEME